jgi:hypothetical protein
MRLIAILSLMVLLGGCGVVPGLGGAEALSAVGTSKTLGDHIVSFTSGKNCSSVRREKGMAYCEEDDAQPPPVSRHCYRTLGSVTCYDRPDPYEGRHQRVEETPPPAIKPTR